MSSNTFSAKDFKLKIGGVEFVGIDYANDVPPDPAKALDLAYEYYGKLIATRALKPEPPPARPKDATPISPDSPVALRPLKFEVKAVRVSTYSGSKTIHVDFIVPERETGEPLLLTYNHAVLPHADPHYLAEQASIAIRAAFEHEVREMLYLGAERAVEPHPETKNLWVAGLR